MTENKMQAIRLTQPCAAADLKPTQVDVPQLKPGYALVKVRAFGINESEVTSRKGESSPDFQFPRILGIEGVGVIDQVNANSSFKPGQQVATMMGGMGRAIDGSYAEYMLVKEENLIPFESDLDWSILGALPEMLQTAYGSISQGLHVQSGDLFLVRGGSSTVGLMASVLARHMGVKVIATTRNAAKLTTMKELGIDYPVLDDQDFVSRVQKIAPNKVDKALELVGFSTLFQDMGLVKDGGLTCFTGALGGQWTLDNFSPFMIPTGVYLTSYAGEAKDLPAEYFSHVLNMIEEHKLTVPIAKVYNGLGEVGQAQANLESGKFSGKHVVVL
ncbi:zinc-binding dehydrogenase [Limosilactobacillus pontis]|uniref:zinc-binding dehydrogenase n=2 Tax=Limosilactobacillus TaxID=2742598 RepID=UPI0022465C70|nr:zinc-binding dehydrogenase [Limosilactobacillus pontis]MCX2187281.1 zinc-binding dehydrogenase [Limosilactobacillus pontis]MCX2189037.1 zinc-binding dehydrogenase [Limosilactobacillus pontis]